MANDEPTHLDAELDAVLIGGREPAAVTIADYDDRWPARFEAERERIDAALGAVVRRIEHIGSTAVAGRALADRQWRDVNYYAEAKSPVMNAILARARRERG